MHRIAAAADRWFLTVDTPPWSNRSTCYVLSAVALCADYFTGPKIQFPVFFIVPIFLCAWHRGIATAVVLAVVLSSMRLAFHFLWGDATGLFVPLINGAIRAFVFIGVAALVDRTAKQTRKLRERLNTLEGLLPICSYCKDIRDEKGEWSRVEEYVTSRTTTQFSHTYCPKCLKIHFPDDADDIIAGQS